MGARNGIEQRIPGRTSRGFSLIEIAAVLTITGILAGASYAALSAHMPTAQLTAAVRDLIDNMRNVRQKAITEGNNHIITFDLIRQCYELWDDEDSDGITDPGERIVLVEMPENVVIVSPVFGGGNRLTFKPNGGAIASGSVSLRNSKGVTKQLRVYRATGQIKVED